MKIDFLSFISTGENIWTSFTTAVIQPRRITFAGASGFDGELSGYFTGSDCTSEVLWDEVYLLAPKRIRYHLVHSLSCTL